MISAVLIHHRQWTLAIVILSTLAAAWMAREIRMDESVQPLVDQASEDFLRYRTFVSQFGNEEVLLIAIHSEAPTNASVSYQEISRAQAAVAGLNGVTSVVSIVDILQAVQHLPGVLSPRDPQRPIALSATEMDRLRQLLPETNRLISPDFKAAGLVVSLVPDIARGKGLRGVVAGIESSILEALPGIDRPIVVGLPILRLAVKEYTIRTAVLFGGLAVVLGTCVAFYIFRSIRVTAITATACFASLAWVLGGMALLKIPVNSITCLCFGFILVVATTITTHVVTHFFEAHRKSGDRMAALHEAVHRVFRPCLFCTLTTAVGFSSFLFSPVASIREAGWVISLGVVFTFILTLPLAVILLSMLRPPSQSKLEALARDATARSLGWLERMGVDRPNMALVIGVVFLIGMGAGIPKITTDTYLLNALHEDAPEKQAMVAVDRLLGLPDSISILIATTPDHWGDPQFWVQIGAMEARMRALPQVTRTESPVAFISLVQGFGMPLAMVLEQAPSFIPAALNGFLNPRHHTARVAVYVDFKNPPNLVKLTETLAQIADRTIDTPASVTLTGQLGLAASQSVRLIDSQRRSLVVALVVITVLMIIQLRSFIMGLLSLIPNVFPLITIFGCMGWLGIKLDPITIFSAVVSFGLSVDDTIHYLTHLKEQLRSPTGDTGLKACLSEAFKATSRAMFSTTAVLVCSCIALFYSPFQHIASLGLLIAAAAVSAYWADVVFMPAVILRLSPIHNRIIHRSGNTGDTS